MINNNINNLLWEYRYMNNKTTYIISIVPLILIIIPIVLFIKHTIDMLNVSLFISALITMSGMGWFIWFLNGLEKCNK